MAVRLTQRQVTLAMRSRAILISAISHSLLMLFMYVQVVGVHLHNTKPADYSEAMGYSIGFAPVIIGMAAGYGILVGVFINATIPRPPRPGPPPAPDATASKVDP